MIKRPLVQRFAPAVMRVNVLGGLHWSLDASADNTGGHTVVDCSFHMPGNRITGNCGVTIWV